MSFRDDLRNAVRLIFRPALLREYAAYLYSRFRHDGVAVRELYDGVKISGFQGFSEFHSAVDHVEPHEHAFLTSCSLPDGVIVDVGANLGVVSLIEAHRFPTRPIHAFEPHPETAADLKENIVLNEAQNVSVHNEAVGEENTDILFQAHPKSRATAKQSSVGNEHAIEVSCVSLDTWADQNDIDTISLLKVDVEGYETAVLEGAKRLLQNHRVGIVYFEVCPLLTRKAGFSGEAPASILEDCGYSLYRLSDEGSLISTVPEEAESVELENWVAFRP